MLVFYFIYCAKLEASQIYLVSPLQAASRWEEQLDSEATGESWIDLEAFHAIHAMTGSFEDSMPANGWLRACIWRVVPQPVFCSA